MRLDTDGDGKVSKQEAGDLPEFVFDRMDANSDGVIEKSEIEAARQRRSSGGGFDGPGGVPPGGGPGGN
jgi:uncharacterized membrane protein